MKNTLSVIQGRNGESIEECYTALRDWLTCQGFKSIIEETGVVVEIDSKKYYGISVFVRAFYDVYIQADNRFLFVLKFTEEK